jgi:hypothetical protein
MPELRDDLLCYYSECCSAEHEMEVGGAKGMDIYCNSISQISNTTKPDPTPTSGPALYGSLNFVLVLCSMQTPYGIVADWLLLGITVPKGETLYTDVTLYN